MHGVAVGQHQLTIPVVELSFRCVTANGGKSRSRRHNLIKKIVKKIQKGILIFSHNMISHTATKMVIYSVWKLSVLGPIEKTTQSNQSIQSIDR